MIEKMLKAYCAAHSRDSDRLLEMLRDRGVLHLVPVDPAGAVPEEKLLTEIDQIARALQVLTGVEAAGKAPDMDGRAAAREVLDLERRGAEGRSRHVTLHRRLEKLAPWGDTRTAQLGVIEEAGIHLEFYSIPAGEEGKIDAECVQAVSAPGAGKHVIAVAGRSAPSGMPEGARRIPPPAIDKATILEEAAQVAASLEKDAERLRTLAHLKDRIQAAQEDLERQVEYNTALGGALANGDLFAIQGWVPSSKADGLTTALARADFENAVFTCEPDEDEHPPTLIGYPGWAKPIRALFEILGTVPGYHELDLSAFFMIAMPIFAAILIGDGGYGLLFILAGLAFYRRAVDESSVTQARLLVVIGAATLLWGILTGSYFGLGPVDFCKAGGVWQGVGLTLNKFAVVGVEGEALAAASSAGDLDRLRELSKESMAALRLALMKLSFIIAVLHLVTARIREAIGLAPDQRALASIGWSVLLCGMFGVVWYLFFTSQEEDAVFSPVILVLLGTGACAAILFSVPDRNPLKRLGLGFASFLLPFMSTFSDTMSYIRLMAVSLASVYIAQVFNMLGSQLAGAATWLAGGVVVVFGHGLNIGLCLIAIFAHGVRLNMLEFSNNAGVEWSGYPFKPFADGKIKEN